MFRTSNIHLFPKKTTPTGTHGASGRKNLLGDGPARLLQGREYKTRPGTLIRWEA